MYFIKKSQRKKPKVSFVLLDWSVRESFHILHYLKNQECDRDDFEVIVIEYYGREYDGIRKYEDQVDSWVVMEMAEDCYYHKHLMYNIGIVISSGDIISICDSDAMVKPTYVSKIIESFNADKNIVFHMDQFRNNKKEYYPFNYPTFDEVIGEGCINYASGLTSGVVDDSDPIHARNYGACMCASREDLIKIGGADEHIDYVGHVCGPYDMTFRLFNAGKREIWSEDEFMYHTWHPGSDGVDNYMGPHDGRNMSTTSLLSLVDKRIYPLVENKAIRKLRESKDSKSETLVNLLIDEQLAKRWKRDLLDGHANDVYEIDSKHLVETYFGARIFQNGNIFTIERIQNDHIVDISNTSTFESIEQARTCIKAQLTRNTAIKITVYKILAKILYVFRLLVHVMKEPKKLLRWKNLLKTPEKIARDIKTRNIFSSSIVDLMIFLNGYKSNKKYPYKLILLDKIDEVILKLFIRIGVLPKITIRRIMNSHDLIEVIQRNKEGSEKMLVPASTYIRFYMTFIDRKDFELIIV